MFSCLWRLWDWLDPTSMENKKGNLGNIPNNEALGNEAIPKHIHNTAPQHLRLLQYGLKIPNHQHSQLNQPSLHQHPSRPVTPHLHQHQHQSQPVYQSLPSHLQHSPHQHQSPTLNIYQNQTFQQIPHHHQSNLQSQSPLPNNYYYQNTNQPPLHVYNLNNQNAQVWVPHQPPEHYHPQQQKSEPQVLHNTNTNQTSQQHKPKEAERKKTYTVNYHQQLRSPSAKRPMEAPVTIQGWLHKQGSDGLMLWKKRWFVLSEYCLFYYKGAEEEKLLGSILLPSYKVSVCSADDKANRKFAFKCEHVNMRTYILAADSQDLMMQWVRNLNMACLLQTTSEPEGYLSSTSTPIESVNERQQQQPIQPQNLRNTPIHIHSSSNTTDLSNPSQQELSQYSQPLYANAPPKPRRLTDGYSSPSSDILEKHLNESKYVTLQQPNHNQYNMHTVYIPRNSTTSPINIYGNPQMHLEYLHQASPQQMMYNKRFHLPEYGTNMVGGRENQNSERRTPDTYGRSKLSLSKGSHPSDYEDVYTEQSMYKRPLSPVAYTNNRLNTGVRPYTPVIMRNSKDNLAYTPLQQLKKFPNTIPRPHSADFLEYEVKNQLPIVISRQPRPKSSLDINRHTPNDNYFYSEESYAEKMRKSAQYLPKMSKYSDGNTENEIRHQKRPTSSNKYESETNFHVPRPNSRPTNFNEDYHPLHVHPVRSRSVLSDGSISKELDMDLQNNMRGENYNKENVGFRNQQDLYGYSGDVRKSNREYDQFTRSASARLAQTSGQYEGRPGSHDGERKREESMKRLLEWKQRMLQSPLNRKVNQSLNKNVASKFNPYYRTSENPYPQTPANEGYPDGRRSTNPLPQYNSYSSDDEEIEDGSKENVQTQAGRTTDTFPSISNPRIPAPTTSTTVFNSSPITDELITAHQIDAVSKLPVVCTEINNKTVSDSVEENVFEKPLKIATNNSTHTALVSSLRSEFSTKFEKNVAVAELKSSVASVKSILAEFEKNEIPDSSHTNEDDSFSKASVEENYMTMTSNKSILDPSSLNSTFSCLNLEVDENPYVEMTQGSVISLLDPNNDISLANDMQTYEAICFSTGKTEPLYMELNQFAGDKEDIFKDSKKYKLPDIIMSPQSKKGNSDNKSDSSDADDEASKDLNSLDTPYQRFSLSDTFRPASYYLGASRVTQEHQDSSDSELVSPPPIPTTPPPLDELDNEECVLRDTEQSSILSLEQKRSSYLTLTNLYQDSSFLCSETDHRSHNSDSDVELRMTADYERKLKRRPVSDDFYDELVSLSSRSANDVTNSFDLSGANLESNKYHDYENMYISGEVVPHTNYTHSRDTSRDTMSSQQSVNTFKSGSSSRKSMFTPNDFVLRTRPESSTSIIGEVSGFLLNSSPRSTPVMGRLSTESVQEINSSKFYFSGSSKNQNSFGSLSAPYYYSDLSINTSRTDSNSSILTLNNQRSMNGNKRDITRIVNPIRCNNYQRNSTRTLQHRVLFDTTCKLAAEARSASVDFLNIADKSDNIDKKNIYESDTLKRLKATDVTSNLLSESKSDKFSKSDVSLHEPHVRRSYSLEGLLENVLNENMCASQDTVPENVNVTAEGSHLWEEDSIWRERLRSASQRHTKSLDDLDCIGDMENRPKKQGRGISRLVTYVNDNMFNMPIQNKPSSSSDDSKDCSSKSEGGNFIIDREKLRQWDFLSSAPSDAQSPAEGCINSVVDLGAGVNACESSEQNSTQSPASGSISITTRDTFPRSIVTKKVWTPPNPRPEQSKSTTNLARGYENDYPTQTQSYTMSQGPSQQDLSSDTSQSSGQRRVNFQLGDKMNVSAGELLGRTHEELVLLLIQLRRQSANNLNSIETSYIEIDNIQAQLPKMDAAKRLENLQKLEQIKQHLLELEKQYEKGKPLVNLVDNMVKLGSLYKFPKEHSNYPYVKDRLEFNQQIQERRLLAEEKRDWNRVTSNHSELQVKVQQLYQLDNLIQEESETLQGLQHDKEEIERALGGLRFRLIKGFKDPAEIEQARKQQIVLENELSRVHSMLAQNSRKLEETVAGNARLEQELLVLKQKLQISRQHRNSPQISNAGDSLPCVIGTSAMLESDLHRVQQKVGDLHRQRQELSMQVKQLTDRSNNLQQMRLSSMVPAQILVGNKKKVTSSWRETDLDSMSIVDHEESWDNSTSSLILGTPLYINTNLKQNQESDLYSSSIKSSDSVSDDAIQNLIPQEKQEIKTVRIVKRESERRQRDREKTTVTGKWDTVVEEDDALQNSNFRSVPVQKTLSSTNLEVNNCDMDNSSSGVLSRQSSISNPSLLTASSNASSVEGGLEKSCKLSPVFKSEAAKQIIIEMSTTQDSPKKSHRRVVPKERRRHHTAPHNNLIMKSLNQLPTTDKDFDTADLNVRRARDDLDMERALRQRIDAPDVVRSTLSNKELKYNENTIDNILGTPNKILIPERYVPEQLPQLTAEEQQYRLRKVESIKKMLSDTAIISGSSVNLASDEIPSENVLSNVTNMTSCKIMEEKKQRQHLLQLNQILAKQVMEMSKIVAVKALATLPLEANKLSSDEDDLSPDTPLPIYQQRDNFYS